MGYERVLTTLKSYGKVPAARQAELISAMAQPTTLYDSAKLAEVIAETVRRFQNDR